VDGVTPNGVIFTDRKEHGFETFPALADFIGKHYRLVDEVHGARIFLRNDLKPLNQK